MLKIWTVEEIKHDKLCRGKCPYNGKKIIAMGGKKMQEEKRLMIRPDFGEQKAFALGHEELV